MDNAQHAQEEKAMAVSPRETAPQYDFSVSDAVRAVEIRLATADHNDFRLSETVRTMEMNLAEAGHLLARGERLVRRLESDKAYWKQQAAEATERLLALQADVKEGIAQ